MSRPFSARFGPCVGLISLLVFAGCGSKPGFITGKVTYKGKALNSGAITFYGADGRTDSGVIKSDGTYVVPSAPTGPVKVTVVVRQVKAPPKPRTGPGANSPAHPGSKDTTPPPTPETTIPAVLIPAKYESPDQSGLVYMVTGGNQTIDIDLPP